MSGNQFYNEIPPPGFDEYFDLKKGNKSIDDLNEEFNKLLND